MFGVAFVIAMLVVETVLGRTAASDDLDCRGFTRSRNVGHAVAIPAWVLESCQAGTIAHAVVSTRAGSEVSERP